MVAVTGMKGSFVEVETAEAARPQCGGALPGLGDFRLRWLVAPDDLADVTARRLRVEFDDGSAVELEAGVPLESSGDAWLTRPDGLRLALPADAIGRFYERITHRPADEATRLEPGLRAWGAPLTYDHGRTLPDEGRLDAREGNGVRWINAWAQRDWEGRRVVDVRTGCAVLTVLVPDDRFATPAEAAAADVESAPRGARIVGTVLGGTVWRVDAGASVAWRDGSPAGMVTRPHEFEGTPTHVDGHRCFSVAPAPATAEIDLCFGSGGAREVPRSAAIADADGTLPGDHVGDPSDLASNLGALGVVPIGKESIRRMVLARINDVRQCYVDGLTRDPKLAGTVTVSLTVEPTGSVRVASVKESTLVDRKVEACVLSVVQSSRLPKGPEGTDSATHLLGRSVAIYPFTFAPA